MTPFKSPNYTQSPNDLFDELLPELGYAELKIALALIRLTFGYHRTKVRRSLSKLSAMTGLTEANVISGINSLEQRGLIIKIKDGGVNQYALTLEDDSEAPIATIGAKRSTPIATIGRTIKETVNEINVNDDNQSPLSPDTQGAFTLFNLLGDEAKAKGYKSPKHFPSLLCKEKFEAAELRLGEIELEKAIRQAIQQSILSITRITNYISKWDNQPVFIRGEKLGDYQERAQADPELFQEALRQEARQRIDKAMKGDNNVG